MTHVTRLDENKWYYTKWYLDELDYGLSPVEAESNAAFELDRRVRHSDGSLDWMASIADAWHAARNPWLEPMLIYPEYSL